MFTKCIYCKHRLKDAFRYGWSFGCNSYIKLYMKNNKHECRGYLEGEPKWVKND